MNLCKQAQQLRQQIKDLLHQYEVHIRWCPDCHALRQRNNYGYPKPSDLSDQTCARTEQAPPAGESMDYEYLATCQFDVSDDNDPIDCGEPAVARVWWKGNDDMLVCQEHLDFMLKCEGLSEGFQTPPAGDAQQERSAP